MSRHRPAPTDLDALWEIARQARREGASRDEILRRCYGVALPDDIWSVWALWADARLDGLLDPLTPYLLVLNPDALDELMLYESADEDDERVLVEHGGGVIPVVYLWDDAPAIEEAYLLYDLDRLRSGEPHILSTAGPDERPSVVGEGLVQALISIFSRARSWYHEALQAPAQQRPDLSFQLSVEQLDAVLDALSSRAP